MGSGVFKIPLSVILDRELRCQGSSLSAWCSERGLCEMSMRAGIDGQTIVPQTLVDELAETLGVSSRALGG